MSRIDLQHLIDTVNAAGLDTPQEAADALTIADAAIAGCTPTPAFDAVVRDLDDLTSDTIGPAIVEWAAREQAAEGALRTARQVGDYVSAKALQSIKRDADQHIQALRPRFAAAAQVIESAAATGVRPLAGDNPHDLDTRPLADAADTLTAIVTAIEVLTGEGHDVARYVAADHLPPVFDPDGAFSAAWSPLDVAAARWKDAAFGEGRVVLTDARYVPAARWLAVVRGGARLHLNTRAESQSVLAASDAALAEHKAKRAA